MAGLFNIIVSIIALLIVTRIMVSIHRMKTTVTKPGAEVKSQSVVFTMTSKERCNLFNRWVELYEGETDAPHYDIFGVMAYNPSVNYQKNITDAHIAAARNAWRIVMFENDIFLDDDITDMGKAVWLDIYASEEKTDMS